MTSCCRQWAGCGSQTRGGMARGRLNRMDGNIRRFKEGITDQESVVVVQAKGGQILIKEGKVECNSRSGGGRLVLPMLCRHGGECVDGAILDVEQVSQCEW